MHPNDAAEYIRTQLDPELMINNFEDEHPDGECWKIFLTSESDSYWHQVFDECFLRLDWAIKALYDNGLPVASVQIGISNWD